MRTESVMIQTLCVGCHCRCRHCLLSWDGNAVGAPWKQSVSFATRFISQASPSIPCTFTFGYAMEHPSLREALRILRSLGSPQAEFLQCDGMKERDENECQALAKMLKEEGVQTLNFTFYGLAEYHDRFAGRKGDFALMTRMIVAAKNAGLQVTAGICLTKENIRQAEELVRFLEEHGLGKTRLFVPHEEGRGKTLASIRLQEEDLQALSPATRKRLNDKIYKPEREWIAQSETEETKRTILISLRKDNIERYQKMSAMDVIQEIERLDDAYYAAYPSFGELAKMYGDQESTLLYRKRDLASHYRRLYAQEHGVHAYDVTDERQSGSRRYAS